MSFNVDNCEKWIWTELVGFDNTQPDMGVGEYISALGFKAEAVCLFVSSPDFILQHPEIGSDKPLPPDCCAYAVYSLNEDRKRQEWTQIQVKKLIDELHKYGVKVLVSAMTWHTHDRFHKEWITEHIEVIAWENVGPEPSNNLNPLKRLNDGSYFEDYFLSKLMDVLRDYGFDGWHAADGWGPAMNNIYDADFSDDMVEQFQTFSGIVLPESIGKPCASTAHYDKDACKNRADWIWRNLRFEWIEFYRNRWQSFFKKISDTLHKENKVVMVNSALTRDPFEALYRFGIDYRGLANSGIDGFIVETGAAAQDLVSGDRNRHYDYLATMMLIRAYVPDTKLIFLHVVQDHCENFDGLNHMPTAIEKEVCSLSSIYYQQPDGKLKRCSDGLMVCLGDSIEPDEWRWLKGVWEIGFSGNTVKTAGPTLVWSDDSLNRQLSDFVSTRRWHTQKILYKLMENGASIQTVTDIDNVDHVDGAVILINPALYTEEQITKVLQRKDRPVIMIGGNLASLPDPDFHFCDISKDDPLHCWVYGVDSISEVKLQGYMEDDLPVDVMGIVEAHFFINELDSRKVSDDFLRACANIIQSELSSVRILEGGDYIKAFVMNQQDGKLRVLLKSDCHYYCKATIDIGIPVKSVKTLTRFPFAPVSVEGSIIKQVVVPNMGVVILDVIPA